MKFEELQHLRCYDAQLKLFSDMEYGVIWSMAFTIRFFLYSLQRQNYEKICVLFIEVILRGRYRIYLSINVLFIDLSNNESIVFFKELRKLPTKKELTGNDQFPL